MASKDMRCRWCKAPVIYIMSEGYEVKCDPEAVPYREIPNGREVLMLSTGQRIRGTTYIGMGVADGLAYRLHYQNCPGPKNRRNST